MEKSFIEKQFYYMFDGLFNELWLVPLLYKYYKLNVAATRDSGRRVNIWDLTTNELICTSASKHAGVIQSICIDEKYNTVISGSSDSTIKSWNLMTGELIHTFTGHVSTVLSVAICNKSQGGTIIVSSCDRTIKIWDSMTGQLIRTCDLAGGHTNGARSVCINKKYNQIISCGIQIIKIWDLVTGDLIRTFPTMEHTYGARSVCCDEERDLIISGDMNGIIKVWNLITGEFIRNISSVDEHTNCVESICISKGYYNKITPTLKQTYIISGSLDYTIKVWDLMTGEIIYTLTDTHTLTKNCILSVAVYDNVIVSEDGLNNVNSWDLTTGLLLCHLDYNY
jgi:WD40 repeat protein